MDIFGNLQLNADQIDIINQSHDQNIVVNGLAGCSKTTVLLARAKSILLQNPAKILILAFNSAVQVELNEKKQDTTLFTSEESKLITVKTFHSVALTLVSKFYKLLNIQEAIKVMDSFYKDILPQYKHWLNTLALDDKQIRAIYGLRQQCIMSGSKFSMFLSQYKSLSKVSPIIITKALAIINEQMLATGHVTYTDILNLASQLPEHCFVTDTYKYLLIDEAQDLNQFMSTIAIKYQSALISMFAVGDKHQLIYGWNYATTQFLDNLTNSNEFKLLPLRYNYRSTDNILALANGLLTKLGSEEFLIKGRTDNFNPKIDYCIGLGQIYPWLMDKINNEVQTMILYRSIKSLPELELWLNNNKVSYYIYEGSFFSSPAVLDIIAIPEFIINPSLRPWSYLVNQKQFIGNTLASTIWNATEGRPTKYDLAAVTSNSKRALLTTLFKEIKSEQCQILSEEPLESVNRYLPKLEQYWQSKYAEDPAAYSKTKQYLNALVEFLDGYSDWYSALTTINQLGSKAKSQPKEGDVLVSTIHKQKGREYSAVLLWDLGEGRFPTSKYNEEELRLQYVAVTRAKDYLALGKLYIEFGNSQIEDEYARIFTSGNSTD